MVVPFFFFFFLQQKRIFLKTIQYLWLIKILKVMESLLKDQAKSPKIN